MSNNQFITKDSGNRESFSTGSLRDTNEGKPRYDLISIHGLKRVSHLMARGAKKYGERNWEKGQPASRFYESAFRHLISYREGDRSEDHLAAVVFNIFGIIHMEDDNRKDMLDFEFYDEVKGKPFSIVCKDDGLVVFQSFNEKEILNEIGIFESSRPDKEYFVSRIHNFIEK